MAFIESQIKSKQIFYEKVEGVFWTVKENLVNYRLYSKTIAELNSLSARELSDLGLSRSMIKYAAHAAVYEKRDSRKSVR